MIPRFFRCGDPSKKCPLAVTREIIEDKAAFKCPCSNDVCSSHREEVGLVEGLTNGRAKIAYAAVAALALTIVLLLLLSGGNSAERALAELRSRFSPLQVESKTLDEKLKATMSTSAIPSDIKASESVTVELEKQVAKAVAGSDATAVASLHKKIETQISAMRGIAEGIDQPKQGVGVIAAEAKSLLTKLDRLDDEAQSVLEKVVSKRPQAAEACDNFLLEISECQGRVRRLVSPANPSASNPANKALKLSLMQLVTRLDSAQKRLNRFAPPPPLPFNAGEANLVIAASGELAGELVAPLVAAWSGSVITPGEDGNFYLAGGSKGNILVETCTTDLGFGMLSKGKVAVFFANRAPSPSELAQFGSDFRESRSAAEVIALDALTLLVHPENEISKVTIVSPFEFRFAAGGKSSIIREKAKSFGLPLEGSSELSGEQAALADKNILSLGLYHEEGTNLRAKRLAVQASAETLALKPSPFTIATEDYLYSFRIVAWTPSNANENALALVKFATSNSGQEIVSKQGFVDLRLVGSQETVPPEILAALGAAIGSGTISSAVRLSTNFRFDVGKAVLDLKGQADLERLPRFVFEKYSSHKVVILGFTDSDGGPKINMPLSKERAEFVAADLRRSKIDAHSAGLGSVFPLDSNNTDSGKAKNRRAEVWVVRP